MDISNIDEMITDIVSAERLIDEIKDYYYRVRKKLESFHSLASPVNNEKPIVSYEEKAELRANRLRTINRILAKNNQPMIKPH